MYDLKGKTALVTAGSRGLGAEIVRQLAELGAAVAFTYLKNRDAAAELQAEINSSRASCVAIQADAASHERAHEVVGEVRGQLGNIDILVCSAGIARSDSLIKTTEQDWDDVMNVSLKGAFNYIHALAPAFMESEGGKVVCVGSINGLRGRVGTVSYNVAKAGLTGLVKTAAAELGRYNINVNLVAPGFIETPSQRNTPELIRDLVLKECAIERLGTPGDIASVVAFLCTKAARHVTGQVIKVDAGQYL